MSGSGGGHSGTSSERKKAVASLASARAIQKNKMLHTAQQTYPALLEALHQAVISCGVHAENVLEQFCWKRALPVRTVSRGQPHVLNRSVRGKE